MREIRDAVPNFQYAGLAFGEDGNKGADMYQRLQKEAFQRARKFLQTKARPLDRELFRFWFEDGTRESVEAELERFQNEDGGFHGLESDLRLPQSSPIATSLAFQY